MIGLIYAGVQNAYFIYQNHIIPLYYSIPFFIIVCLILPLHWDGTLFSPDQVIQVKSYVLFVFEVFMNYSVYSAVLTLNKFWIVFCCFAWRILMLYEPYAMWATLHTLVSSFRAFYYSHNARSLIVIYLLHFEYFLILYCCIWFMNQTVINRIIIYFSSAYYVIYIFLEIFSPNFPFSHKVQSIYSAKQPNQYRGPAIM